MPKSEQLSFDFWKDKENVKKFFGTYPRPYVDRVFPETFGSLVDESVLKEVQKMAYLRGYIEEE